MAVDRTRRVEELFHAALARSAGERAAFVREVCGTDDALADEVGSLLAAHATPVSPLERQPASVLAAPVALPRRLGPWELLDEIAHGGMGTVLRARRADGQFEKEVAVKLIQVAPFASERDRHELVRKFLEERQLLATLDHPHIARLLDGGATDDGTPWLAMELVAGLPIDRYCRERSLARRQVLALFRDVCLAVQHAHGKLVAHRDLKPANILVVDPPRAGAPPVPKLLDFGIAKLLAPAPAGPAADPATLTVPRLTPAYASPEQFRGEPATTATDVYSLGVVLYELLTGSVPHDPGARSRDGDGLALHELARKVCEERPRPPGELDPELRGELETIVLKALEKEPARRYESAAALAGDVERFLTGHPIAARPASTTYRFLKTVQRHKLPFGIAAAAFLALSAASVWMWRLKQDADFQRGTAEQRGKESDDARRVADERSAEADRRRAESEETAQLFIDMFGAPDPLSGGAENVTVLQAMDRGMDVAAARLATRPEILVALRQMVARTYEAIGEHDKAWAQARAVAEYRHATLGPDHSETAAAELIVLRTLSSRGDDAAVEAVARALLDQCARLGGFSADFLLETHLRMVNAIFNLGRLDEAYGLAEWLGPEIERELAPDSDLAFHMEGLRCRILVERGHHEESLLRAQQLCERVAAQHGPRDYRIFTPRSLAISSLYALRRPLEAEAAAGSFVHDAREVLGPHHPMVISGLIILASCQKDNGKLELAEMNAEEAVRLTTNRWGAESRKVWGARILLANIAVARGNLAGAIEIQKDVLTRQVEALGEEDMNVIISRSNLGALYTKLGNFDEAARWFEVTLDIALNAGLSESLIVISETRWAYADLLASRGRYADAEEQLLKSTGALRADADADGTGHARLTRHLELLVRIYLTWGKPLEAMKIRAQIPAAR